MGCARFFLQGLRVRVVNSRCRRAYCRRRFVWTFARNTWWRLLSRLSLAVVLIFTFRRC